MRAQDRIGRTMDSRIHEALTFRLLDVMMVRRCRVLLVQNLLVVFVSLLAAAFAADSALGQTPPDSTPPSPVDPASTEELSLPSDKNLAAEIPDLISRLGSSLYAKREGATTRLIEIGAPAFAQLRQAYLATDELEVRLRIETIVHEAYFDHQVYDRNGFLGISQAAIPIEHDDDERIRQDHVGIEVLRVIKNTAAEQARIKQGDVIIALDGEPIPASGPDVVTTFGELVRVRRPGVRLVLTVLRKERQFNVTATLGTRPREYYGTNQRVVHEMLIQTGRRFQAFWGMHFHRPPDARYERVDR